MMMITNDFLFVITNNFMLTYYYQKLQPSLDKSNFSS